MSYYGHLKVLDIVLNKIQVEPNIKCTEKDYFP